MFSLLEYSLYKSSPFNGFSKKRIKVRKNFLSAERVDRKNIELLPFNTPYWLGLPEDKKQLIFDMDRGKYFTITSKGSNIGVVGIFLNQERPSDSYFQIYIDPVFRGLGLGKPVAFIVAKKYNINKLVNIIDVNKSRG